MSTPFIGEIRVVGFNFAPVGWAKCDGSLLSIAQNDALFALIGTTFGGDGQTTFALPNFQSRVMVGTGNNTVLGQMAGAETVTITNQTMPTHQHLMSADNEAGGGNTLTATQGVYAGVANAARGDAMYGNPGTAQAAPNMLGTFGGSQPHDNLMPYLALNVIIALEGIFPSRN